MLLGLGIYTHALANNTLLKENVIPLFEIIDRDSGLSNLSVSSIVQDKYGFLWFGTQGGLNRYDGREMKVVRRNPFKDDGLVHNLIQTMYYDEKLHEIWIGTYQGVSRYNIHHNTFENFTVSGNGLSNPVVIAITIDKNHDVWIGTMEGLNRLDIETGDIKQYDIPGNVVRALKIDSTGRLLIGTYEGLLYYDELTENIKSLAFDLPSPYVMVVDEFEKGILTLGLWDGGIVQIDLEKNDIQKTSFADNRVYTLTQTEDKTFWVGTWGGGLYAITKDGSVSHFAGDGAESQLSHPVVYSMLQDHSGILWIGTNGGGICKMSPRKSNYVQFYHDVDNPNSLSPGKINKIFGDSNQNLWFAIYNDGLNRYDPLTDSFIKYKHDSDNPNSLPNNSVVDMIELSDNRLLLGTGEGLAYYDMTTEKFYQWPILPKGVIVYALADTEEELWIGTYTNGIYCYNKTSGELQQYYYKDSDNYSLSDNLVYDILVDTKQRVWIATNNGLNVLIPGQKEFKVYYSAEGDYHQLGSNTIRVVFEDSKGRIWIGTVGGGIALYNEEEDVFKSFIEENGMSSNVVTGILESDDGRIWIATHQGISIIEPQGYNIFVLTPEDGIGGWEFNAGHFRDKKGTLLFGGIHGITSIPKDFADAEGLLTPKLYITGVELFQKPVDFDKSFFNDAILHFEHRDKFLSFQFVALDFDSPEKITFSYKLQGFDKDWINAGTYNYASYSNLPNGKYTFMVQAKTIRGIKSEVAKLEFTIATPWYKTVIAYICYIIIVYLLLLGAFKLREGKLINQRNSELAKLNTQLAQANEQLESLSIKDPLTGLYNRRYFNEIITEYLGLATRSKASLSIIMLDIDFFKEINDNYGHVAGDYLLIDVGKAIDEVLPRNTDFISRYGGDEFIISLYDTQQKGALVVANKVKRAAENIKVRPEFAKTDKKITISSGVVSTVPDDNTTTKTLIQAADKALYDAKKQGRNCIYVGDL